MEFFCQVPYYIQHRKEICILQVVLCYDSSNKKQCPEVSNMKHGEQVVTVTQSPKWWFCNIIKLKETEMIHFATIT